MGVHQTLGKPRSSWHGLSNRRFEKESIYLREPFWLYNEYNSQLRSTLDAFCQLLPQMHGINQLVQPLLCCTRGVFSFLFLYHRFDLTATATEEESAPRSSQDLYWKWHCFPAGARIQRDEASSPHRGYVGQDWTAGEVRFGSVRIG